MVLFFQLMLLGSGIFLAVFLIAWNFRGRGFGELMFWRRWTEPTSVPRPGGPAVPPHGPGRPR